MTIDELLGVGLGEVGLCLQDFVRLTPSEFRAVTEAARDRQERISREDWARARLMACLSMQPHLTKRLRPQELLPFPWEQEDKENAEAPKDLGKEESQRRFERLIRGERLESSGPPRAPITAAEHFVHVPCNLVSHNKEGD